MNDLALIIAPLGFWNLYTLRLRQVRLEEDQYACGNFITTTEDIEDRSLRRLVELCLRTQPDHLYANAGRNFRNQKAFFEKADKTIQKNVESIVDHRITEAVSIAAQLGVHMFFAPKPGERLKPKDELFFNNDPLKIHAFFTKTADGIDYRLTLGAGIVPSVHQTLILCNNPSLFVIDHTIRRFDEGLGGKLLTPFLKQKVYHIPASLQTRYFRQFILKIVRKIDISSEGFDIDNRHPEGRVVLSLQPTFNSLYTLEMQFVYDTSTFTLVDRREKSVTLHDDGTDIGFVCICRDRAWEASVIDLLENQLHMQPTASLQDTMKWLAKNIDILAQHRITINQRTSRHYVIGRVRKRHDDHWSGDWFQMRVTLIFPDSTEVPLTFFRDAIINGEREVQLVSGLWFVIPEEWFAQYSPAMLFGVRKGKDTLTFHRSQRAVVPADDLESAKSGGPTVSVPLEDNPLPPEGLKTTLRPYQVDGYRWMISHQSEGTGCLLGDDMGLGKTVQAIAVILHYFEHVSAPQPHLSQRNAKTASKPVLPAGEKKNRRNNAIDTTKKKRQAPVQLSFFTEEEMNGMAAQAPQSAPRHQSASQPLPLPQPGYKQKADHQPVLVVAPSSVVFNWRDELSRFAPSLKVVSYTGSSQERIKKQSGLPLADVVLTSYPMLRNDIDVLCRIPFAIAVFDEAHAFRNNTSLLYNAVRRIQARFPIVLTGTPMVNALDELWSLMSVLNPSLLGPYDDFQAHFIHPIRDNLQDIHTSILRSLVAPYILRRLRDDVLDSLPERQDEMVWCGMSDDQALIYEEEVSKTRNLLMDKEKAKNQVVVLAAITRLRRLACSPKMTGIDAASGKVDEIFDRLEALRGTDHKVLLFSEFTSFLDIIADEMQRRGWAYDMLTGQTRDREAIVKHFQQSQPTHSTEEMAGIDDHTAVSPRPTGKGPEKRTPFCQFFLVSLKAGGEGLNLTQADYVFLLDPWWNHATEEQAISRAYRSGQRRSVMVYRFITQDTVEEQILKVQDAKDRLISAILSQEEAHGK